MTFRTFASQLQQQQQDPGTPAQGTAAPDTTIDADIAAFIAEGHQPDEGGDASTEPAAADDGELPAEDDGESPAPDPEVEPEGTDDPADDGEQTDGAAPPQGAVKLDVAALQKAADAGDVVAFVKALGPHGDKLLGGKAHAALRIAVKEVERKTSAAVTQEKRAKELSTALAEKYADPIAARKAAEEGDVDTFIDMVEKWGGHSWNDIMKWAAQGLTGRKERLERKQRTEQADAVGAKAKQEQKVAEVRAWVDGGVKKLAPDLHDSEVVDMVVAEIQAGYKKGITTPAKALPLVRKKLEARYQKLHKVFGSKNPAPPARGKAPSAAAAHGDQPTGSRPSTLEEDIAWTKRLVGQK